MAQRKASKAIKSAAAAKAWAHAKLDGENCGRFPPVYVKWACGHDWQGGDPLYFPPAGFGDEKRLRDPAAAAAALAELKDGVALAGQTVVEVAKDVAEGVLFTGNKFAAAVASSEAGTFRAVEEEVAAEAEKDPGASAPPKALDSAVAKRAAERAAYEAALGLERGSGDDDSDGEKATAAGASAPRRPTGRKKATARRSTLAESDYTETLGYPPLPSVGVPRAADGVRERLVRIEHLCWPLSPAALCEPVTGQTWAAVQKACQIDPHKQLCFDRQFQLACYLEAQLKLLAAMCFGRSDNCCFWLAKALPYAMLVGCGFNQHLPPQIRAGFAALARHLYLDVYPQLPNCGVFVWERES
jgi:hypothetical protein